jgi:AraC-like DNA-binding protein
LSGQHNPETETVGVTRAKQFIARNPDNALCLATFGKAVNTSTFYFCKLGNRAAGLTFTDYLARVRLEKAKALSLDRTRRVSEVAYDVGFQSRSPKSCRPIADSIPACRERQRDLPGFCSCGRRPRLFVPQMRKFPARVTCSPASDLNFG